MIRRQSQIRQQYRLGDSGATTRFLRGPSSIAVADPECTTPLLQDTGFAPPLPTKPRSPSPSHYRPDDESFMMYAVSPIPASSIRIIQPPKPNDFSSNHPTSYHSIRKRGTSLDEHRHTKSLPRLPALRMRYVQETSQVISEPHPSFPTPRFYAQAPALPPLPDLDRPLRGFALPQLASVEPASPQNSRSDSLQSANSIGPNPFSRSLTTERAEGTDSDSREPREPMSPSPTTPLRTPSLQRQRSWWSLMGRHSPWYGVVNHLGPLPSSVPEEGYPQEESLQEHLREPSAFRPMPEFSAPPRTTSPFKWPRPLPSPPPPSSPVPP
ncbi:hypothetical protein A0H81_10134 [Grifola frondosa]|uniref:Uncharacterized protein n=1 Tax=Grifola frondosa TaxID=5627 RepID=A0A1C7M0B3_GRIFR|nr:hypothetical protein A0H81_10134 [Grifola frondosa]